VLVRVKGPLRWAEVGRGTGFDLDHHQRFALPRDQVRLGVTGGKTVVTCHDGVTLRAQKAMSQVFSTPACGKAGIPAATAPPVAQGVQPASDHLANSVRLVTILSSPWGIVSVTTGRSQEKTEGAC